MRTNGWLDEYARVPTGVARTSCSPPAFADLVLADQLAAAVLAVLLVVLQLSGYGSQRTRTNTATPATRTTASSRSASSPSRRRQSWPKSSQRQGRKPLTRPAGNGAKNYAKPRR